MAAEAEYSVTSGVHWDVICVGAGITSLAFAAQLVQKHPGVRILLIDKHTIPGGYATVFRRPKCQAIFDCSLHKLSGMADGGNLRRIFAELGLEKELTLKYPDDYFEACLPGSPPFSLKNNPESVKLELKRRYPDDAFNLDRFFQEVEVHGKNGYYQFQMIQGDYLPDIQELRYAHKHLKNLTVSEAFKERFAHPFLKEILGATGIYVGGFPEDLGYLYFLHVLYATLYKGNAYVLGSSQRLSDTLTKRITDAGGAVMLKTAVKKILTNDAREVVGVETSRGRFYGKTTYINTSPHYALETFFEKSAELNGVVEKLRNLKPSRSTTTLYLTTDKDPRDLGLTSTETMIFSMDHEACLKKRALAHANPCDQSLCEDAYWSSSPMEVTNYFALDEAGGRSTCVNVLDSIAHWPDRKTRAYKEKKARAVKTLLARLLQVKPGLEGHIVYRELSSPRTYLRFTNNTDGAGYGAMVGKNLSAHVFHHNFPFKGVQFLSAWVAGPSYEAAFGYAEMKVKGWEAA